VIGSKSVPVLLAALLGLASASQAQERLKVALVDEPRVGQDAPDFSMPYLTALGPGPADQPFRLRAELGRRVLLVVTGDPEREDAASFWEGFRTMGGTVLPDDLVVIGLVKADVRRTQELAGRVGEGVKFLPDSAGRVQRQYGASGKVEGVRLFLVSDLGRVLYRARGFRFDSASDSKGLRDALGGG